MEVVGRRPKRAGPIQLALYVVSFSPPEPAYILPLEFIRIADSWVFFSLLEVLEVPTNHRVILDELRMIIQKVASVHPDSGVME